LLPKSSTDSEVSSAEGCVNLQDSNVIPGTDEAELRFRLRESELRSIETMLEKSTINELKTRILDFAFHT
jgi:hypothetical protein